MVDFSGSVLVSTTGVVAAGGATPLSAAGGGNGGVLATRAGGACGAGSAADGMRAASRLSCGGWVVSGATCSTTVIRPRGCGTAGERSTETSTPATKTTQAPPATMAANDKFLSRCVRAIDPTQKITAGKTAAVLSRDHNTTRRGSACVTLILAPGPHQRLRRRAGNVDFHDEAMVDACLRRPRQKRSRREIGVGRFCGVARLLRRAGDRRIRRAARAIDHRPHIAVALGGEVHAVGLVEFSRADAGVARADIFDFGAGEMVAQYLIQLARLFVPGLAHAMRPDPDHGELALHGGVQDVVDALVDIFQAAFGIVGAEKDVRRRAGRRPRDLRQRLGAADMDADLGQIVEAHGGGQAVADAVAEHVGAAGK